jgi:SH3-like domain-containing protein
MQMTGFRRGPTAALRAAAHTRAALRPAAYTRAALCAAVLTLAASTALAEAPGTAPQPRPVAQAAATATTAGAPPALARLTAAPAAPAPQTGPAPETGAATADPRVGPVTGFPLPRYVSIKASEANARRGPSRSHRIDWVFQRRNMPVMIVAEHGHWRRVVDRDGAGGWVHYTLLSGVRTAIVEADRVALHARPDRNAMIRAEAERGVVGELRECRPTWCEMEVGGYRGWVEARSLWGVDPGETFD